LTLNPTSNLNLRVIPLGGLGEIGKNMMALECGNDIIVVDCGVQFPTEDLLGVDLIIPDISYLLENSDRVRAILITHGHEDHIGALPFVLPRLNVPVYAPRLAHGLISVKLKERAASRGATVEPIEPNQTYQFGENFKVSWFRVCHSIPDSMGIAIETPLGTVIHTGDFKIDHTPVDGHTLDLAALAEMGSRGVLLLCSDSTYAELSGFTPSEQIMSEALNRAIGDAEGRVIVATFASLISRIQQVIHAAHLHQRKVGIVGRSMVDNVNMAAEMGYLDIPEGTLISLNQARGLPPEQVVLMSTGSQGEPTSALVRIANQEHRDVRIIPGDTVIISATPIPGNELLVSRTIDRLLMQGAKVLHDRVALVHVHGHASQEELKMMLSLVRPKYFVPVHGEYRHLAAHAKLAWDLKVGESGIFVLVDGDVLELSEKGGEVVETVSAGPIYIDGLTTHDTSSDVLRDRRALSRDGVVTVVLSVDTATGLLTSGPKIVASGFMEQAQVIQIFDALGAEIERVISEKPEMLDDQELVKSQVRDLTRKFLYSETHRRPMVIPVVLEI
jgi:ribonuclease J